VNVGSSRFARSARREACAGEDARHAEVAKLGGDFARACAVAHEVGHHMQNLLGESRRVRWFRRGYDTGAFDPCDTFKEAGLSFRTRRRAAARISSCP
jgi:predicted metalloprotease